MIGKIIKKNAGIFIFLFSIMLLIPNITAITFQNDRRIINFISIEDRYRVRSSISKQISRIRQEKVI